MANPKDEQKLQRAWDRLVADVIEAKADLEEKRAKLGDAQRAVGTRPTPDAYKALEDALAARQTAERKLVAAQRAMKAGVV